MTQYRAIGITDGAECERCGRTELRRTILIETLDAEGNGTGETAQLGTDCAARLTQRSASGLRLEGEQAQRRIEREAETLEALAAGALAFRERTREEWAAQGFTGEAAEEELRIELRLRARLERGERRLRFADALEALAAA